MTPNLFDAGMESQIDQAVSILKRGGVVVFPTDTVYAVGALASNTPAVRRVFDIKGRANTKGLPALIGDISQINQVAKVFPPLARKLANEYWPGGLTLVLPKTDNIPLELTGGNETVAIRIPNQPAVIEMLKRVGEPVTGTSANLSGCKSSLNAAEAKKQLGDRVDFILDGGQVSGGVESTIIAVNPDGLKIIRQGAIKESDILETAAKNGFSA
ncbi:MAG: L-threonylcarbamoyladenylate synthase [Dehalococcoides mccartyi]|uniref:L-threonylcarbamoyladenylate synthase n=1 Tax=Dehalococcoides mccartyi TaxID=61435 RepID=UPI0025C8AB3B|nr:L-threonylcarbamoyladenylate synthase [Dehalococcoides mccartyi]MDN4185639.1 L-threonylcarbamoyladenylate synthase [Dehalococcoides mccartyi]